VPQLPSDDEVVAAPASARDDNMSVFNAIDERFDQRSLSEQYAAVCGDLVLCVSALSRYCRNSAKLHRILAFLLAHQATVLTTNYLIRPTDVWARRGGPRPLPADPRRPVTSSCKESTAARAPEPYRHSRQRVSLSWYPEKNLSLSKVSAMFRADIDTLT
jgi:hypothetical protein